MTEEDISLLIDSLVRATNFTYLRYFLKNLDLPTSTSIEGLKKNITEYFKENSESSGEKLELIRDFLEEHLLFGRKIVTSYSLPASIDDFIGSITNISENIFSETYPIPLSDERIKDAPKESTLVDIKQMDNGTAMVFCSQREFQEKHNVPINDIADSCRESYKGYELFAIRPVIKQAYDVLFFNKNLNILEARIDCGTEKEKLSRSKDSLLINVLESFNDIVDFDFSKEEKENLFPCVKRIYDNKREGRICELGFEIRTEGSHRLNLRKGKRDLRYEVYHQGGVEAAGEISPFRIAVRWDRHIPGKAYNDDQVEILLPGTKRMLRGEEPLYEVRFVTPFDRASFEYAIDTLWRHAHDPPRAP